MIKFTVNTDFSVGAVHFYYIQSEGKNILIDTGPFSEETKKVFISYIDLLKLDYVFLTHIHIDHSGMIKFISKNSNARIFISEKDAYLLEKRDEWLGALSGIFSSLEFSSAFIAGVIATLNNLRSSIPVPERYEILEKQDILNSLGIDYIKAPYHSQSDVIYLIGRFAFSGDVLLRNIFQTPLIDIDYSNPWRRYNNFKAFCRALYHFKKLNNYTIMPGHNEYIVSVKDTVINYVGKMLNRLIKIKDKINKKSLENLAEIVSKDKNDIHVKYLKASEIQFFKDFLEDPTELEMALNYLGIFNKSIESTYKLALSGFE